MKKIQTDVVVVGSGPAGTSCAYFAAKYGKKVIILEKEGKLGGLSGGGMGVFAVGTPEILALNTGLTVEKAYADYMNHVKFKADPSLVRTLMVRSHETVEWIKSFGIEFQQFPSAYFGGANFTWHKYKDDDHRMATPGSFGVLPIIYPKILEEQPGITAMVNTKAEHLIIEDGKVCGVICTTQDGEEMEIRSEAVFLATGGFAADPQMIQELTGITICDTVFNFGTPMATGDGLKMAWEAGGDKSPILIETIPCLRPPCDGPGGVPMFVGALLRQPTMLLVNKQAKRFANEQVFKQFAQAGNAVYQQKDHVAYVIFDEDTYDAYLDTPVEYQLTGEMGTSRGLREFMEQKKAEGFPDFYIVDSIEELSEQTGLPLETLKKTVADYNKLCEQGYDDEFFKDHHFLRPIKNGKIFCAMFCIGTYGSTGGIRINDRAQVLNVEKEPIEGLYAGGFDANGILGDTFPFEFAGIGSAFSYLYGRIAAETITGSPIL